MCCCYLNCWYCILDLIIDSVRANKRYIQYVCRQSGQDTIDEVRSRDFKRDLTEREQRAREKSKSSRSNTESSSSSKRARLEPISTAALDADDPVDDDDSDDDR